MELTRGQKIMVSRKATRQRRAEMTCKTVSCKISKSKLNKTQKEYLTRIFLEAKWHYNAIISYGEENDIFYYDTKITSVQVKMPSGSFETRELVTLPAECRQTVFEGIKSNVKSLAALKKNGHHVGRLKFKSEIKSLHFKMFNVKNIQGDYIKLPKCKKLFKVAGLNQIPNNAETACAKLIQKAGMYFINITIYIPKEEKVYTAKKVGIDFGISSTFVTSDGEKFNFVFEEPERIKNLSRKLARQKKGSNNYKRTLRKLNRTWYRFTNKKKDAANKFVHKFKKYNLVVIQDENLKGWHKGLFGKQVQHSILGLVKAKLQGLPNVVVIGRFEPTTQLCRQCGQLNKHSLDKRIYICECGYSEDRDIHAANNILQFGLNKLHSYGTYELSHVEIE